MFCVNCGNQLPENSRFCNICGTDLSARIAPPAQGAATSGGYSQPQKGPGAPQQGSFQPSGFSAQQGYPQAGFGQQGGFNQQYFAPQGNYPQQGYGGALGGMQQGYPQQGFEQPAASSPRGYVPPEEPGQPQGFAPADPDEVVMDAGKVTFYTSEKAMVVGGSGKLRIFPDRIEYMVLTGSQAGFAFGPLIGGAMMMAKKGKVDEFYYDQIKDVRMTKHMGLVSKVVLEFVDGKTCAFVPMEKGSKSNAHAQKIHDTIKQFLRKN